MAHMSTEFEMSLVMGLQVRKTKLETFISQEKYAKSLVSKFELGSIKHRRTLIGAHEKIARDETRNGVDQTL